MTVIDLFITQLQMGLIVYFSFSVILTERPVQSVINLIFCFILASGLLLGIGADFWFIIFILIYVGAIAVLFLFVNMMLDVKILEITESLYKYLPVGIITCFLFFFEIYYLFKNIYNEQKIISSFFFEFKSLILNLYPNFLVTGFNSLVNKEFNNINYWQKVQTFSSVLYLDFFLVFWLGGVLLLIAMVAAISISLNKNLWVLRQNFYSQINKNDIFSVYLYEKILQKKKKQWWYIYFGSIYYNLSEERFKKIKN